MIAASVLGAVVGAKIVCKFPINAIRGVLAVTLPFVAVVLVNADYCVDLYCCFGIDLYVGIFYYYINKREEKSVRR